MLLYHFSNYDFKILKPSYFGKNHYSKNEAQASNFKRSFCYDTTEPQEAILNGSNFRYTVRIDKALIYDLDRDKQGFKEKFNYDIDRILKAIKATYTGASYTTSFKTFILLTAVKVQKESGKK